MPFARVGEVGQRGWSVLFGLVGERKETVDEGDVTCVACSERHVAVFWMDILFVK